MDNNVLIEYHTWAKQNVENNYRTQIKNAISRLNANFDQQKANALAAVLNDYLHNDIGAQFRKDAIQTLQEKNNELLINANSLAVSTEESRQAWQKFREAEEVYKNLVRQCEKIQTQEVNSALDAAKKRVEDARRQALTLQGSINKYKGDLLEQFLAVCAPAMAAGIIDLSNTTTNELMKEISGKVVGSKTQMIITAKGQKSSQQKTDIEIKFDIPQLDINTLNLSAKNYSALRNISLTNNASLVGLTNAWSNSDLQTDFYNALSVWNPTSRLLLGQLLICIQALIGTNITDGSLVNYLVLNVSSKKEKSIRILSIYSFLINQLNSIQSIENVFYGPTPMFQFQMIPAPQWWTKPNKRNESEMQEKINQSIVNVHLCKSMLYLHMLSQYV